MLFWKQYFKFLYKYLISYDTLKSKGKFRGLKSKKHGYNLTYKPKKLNKK